MFLKLQSMRQRTVLASRLLPTLTKALSELPSGNIFERSLVARDMKTKLEPKAM